MARVSAYERLQIDSLLQSISTPILPGSGLALFDDTAAMGREVYEIAVAPAMREVGLNLSVAEVVFDETSSLAKVCRCVQLAEVIVADVTELNPSVMYVLGLAHALGRCPILLTADETMMPFDLRLLRHLEYRRDQRGLVQLREELTRALRVFGHPWSRTQPDSKTPTEPNLATRPRP